MSTYDALKAILHHSDQSMADCRTAIHHFHLCLQCEAWEAAEEFRAEASAKFEAHLDLFAQAARLGAEPR